MSHAGLPQVLLPPGRVRGKCPDARTITLPTCKKDSATESWWWAVLMLRFLPRPIVGTCRDLQHSRSHARTPRVRSRCGQRHETCRPRHYIGTQRTHRPPDAVRPWMCAWAPLQRQLVETPHRRHFIANSRTTEMKSGSCGNRAFTALLLGRRATAPSRNSLQYADIASSRNGHH